MCSQIFAEVARHLRCDRVHLTVGEPCDRDLASCLELDDLGRLLRVRLRVGVEAVSGLLPEAALRDEASQD